ncbi:TetR/AcrR family transcriptional regulator [Streptomyces cirratus]|uniref:TetR/AcrR family transcriptional regulator n=1 Tax=Streptomyces cirratus TaxID=68187 RepID=UPI0036225369
MSSTDGSVAATADAQAGAETGREAIVRAARRAFTLRPYAEVTMRGIAAAAGVSPSLIVKRFGSKEALFNTVVDFRSAADELFAAPPSALGRHLVLTMVELRERFRGTRCCGSSSPSASRTSAPCSARGFANRSPTGWPRR